MKPTVISEILRVADKLRGDLSFYRGQIVSPRRPNVVAIEITNACNLRCSMCPRTVDLTREVRTMDMRLFKHIIDLLHPSNETVLLHYMGEPLLHPKLDEMIAYTKSKGHKASFFTNALLLDEKKALMVLKSGLDRLTISFELAKKTYNTVRVGGDYDRAKQNILKFLALRKQLHLRKPYVSLASAYFERDEARSEDAFWRARVDRLIYSPVHDWAGNSAHVSRVGAPVQTVGKKICKAPWTNMIVTVEGKVIACCNDYNAGYALGDVEKEPLEAIWNGARMQALRKVLLAGRQNEVEMCRHCTFGPGMQGDVRDWTLLFRQASRLGAFLRFIR